MLLVVSSSPAVTRKAFGDRPIVLDGAGDAYASEYLFVTSPHGIHTYNRNSGTWGRITRSAGLPDNSVNALGLDDGILWAATPSGLASADLKVNDWQTYDLPGAVLGLTFDDDYAWAAGRFGLARFDKITEQWEQVGSAPANDVLADEDYVWLATDSGVLRYSREFNKLEPTPAPQYAFDRVFGTPDRIWFFSPGRLVAYRPSSAAWSGYRGLDITGCSAIGDSLFVLSQGKVLLYEPGSDNWVAFRDIENLPAVSGLYASGAFLVLATDRGLLVDSLAARAVRTWTVAAGLSTDTIAAGYQDGHVLVVVTGQDIEYQDRATGIWKSEPLAPTAAPRQQFLYVDDAGGHLRLVPETDVRLTGRAYYAISRNFTADSVGRTESRTIDLNLAALHSGNRSLSLYYDDTDKDQVDYGFAFRGTGADVLHRANGGFVQSEYADFDLVPRLSLFGGNARLRFPSPQFLDSSIPPALSLQAGKLQSRLHSDFFTGRSLDKQLALPDVNYAKNAFYHVYQPARPLRRTADTAFIDDHQALTNGLDTRLGYTVAGVTGDFDPLVRGKGYHIDYDRGIIQFAVPVRPADAVCLKLGSAELVVQSESVTDHVMENVYMLGSDIIPGSLELTITDTLGQPHALGEFGLDDDGDGRVDPEFLNCDLGFLTFPAARPFPEPVYTLRQRCYTMNVRYRSYSLFYYLSSSPVVRSSEEVLVDGEPAERGTDYTIDYTSGTLVFLKPDIITDYSEITVQYSSVERAEKSLFLSAQPEATVAPGIRVSPGFSHVDSENMVHLSGRYETQGHDPDSGSSPLNLRFIPRLAVNTGGALAQHHTITASYRWLSCRTEYQGYAAGFEPFGLQERKYGDLRHGATAALGIEPVRHVRLDGTLLREYLADTALALSVSRSLLPATYSSARLSYLNQALPNGYLSVGRDALPDNNKLRLKASLGHEFNVRSTRLKLSGVYQHTTVDPRPVDLLITRSLSSEFIADAGFTLPIPVSGSIRWRNNQLSQGHDQNPPGDSGSSPESRQRELRGRLNVDAIPGLYYVGTCDINSTSFLLSRSATGPLDYSATSFLFNDLRIAPGRWDSRFSLVNLALGAGTNFDQYCRNLDGTAPVFRLRPLSGVDISQVKDLTTLYGSIQLDPFSELMLRYRRTLNRTGFAYYSLPELSPTTDDEVRIEYQPPAWGVFTGQWTRRSAVSYPLTRTNSLYLEWSRPWSEKVRTKLTTSGRLNRDAWGTGSAPKVGTGELKLNSQVLYRFNTRSYATLDLGASRQQTDTINPQSSPLTTRHSSITLLPGLGLNLNLLRFLYLQVTHQSSFPLGGSPTHTISGRITGQF